MPAIAPVVEMHIAVVTEVASLAQGFQVAKPVVVSVLVYVGNCEAYFAAGKRVWLAIGGAAPLAAVSGPARTDEPADEPPLWMIIFIVDWH